MQVDAEVDEFELPRGIQPAKSPCHQLTSGPQHVGCAIEPESIASHVRVAYDCMQKWRPTRRQETSGMGCWSRARRAAASI